MHKDDKGKQSWVDLDGRAQEIVIGHQNREFDAIAADSRLEISFFATSGQTITAALLPMEVFSR